MDPDGNLQNVIESAVAILREPAGNKYRSIDDISRNRKQFMKDFHSGLFLLHIPTIQFIIDAEDRIRTSQGLGRREAAAQQKAWTRIRQLLRCINDAIAWSALQVLREDASLFVRRTCRNQPRGDLKDQNHESVIKTMERLFSGGEVLPIWNDATRCLDISDITLFSPHGISFIELKEGKVNAQILDMMDRTHAEDIPAKLDAFFERYGQKGMQQIERIVRQEDRADKLVELVKDDDVFDPFFGAERRAVTPEESLEVYDDELSLILDSVRSKDFVVHTVDDCLHIVAFNTERGISKERGQEVTRQHLQDKMCKPSSAEVDCRDMVMSLQSSFDYATAMPIMLRPWSTQDVARVCLGQTEVYFGFDINAWGRLLRTSRLAWSSLRRVRQELGKAPDKELLVVRGRIPYIIGPRGKSWYLGTGTLQRMLCEGIRPASLARHYDQIGDIDSPLIQG